MRCTMCCGTGRLLGLLAGGLVLTVGIALGCWYLTVPMGDSSVRTTAWPVAPSATNLGEPVGRWRSFLGARRWYGSASLPSESGGLTIMVSDVPTRVDMTVWRIGLPMSALQGVREDVYYGQVSEPIRRGMVTVGIPWAKRDELKRLDVPIRPIALGLAVDAVFWAGVLWLVVSGPKLVRQRWRLRGGRCPACGYSQSGLSGDPDTLDAARCPECGDLADSVDAPA